MPPSADTPISTAECKSNRKPPICSNERRPEVICLLICYFLPTSRAKPESAIHPASPGDMNIPSVVSINYDSIRNAETMTSGAEVVTSSSVGTRATLTPCTVRPGTMKAGMRIVPSGSIVT